MNILGEKRKVEISDLSIHLKMVKKKKKKKKSDLLGLLKKEKYKSIN